MEITCAQHLLAVGLSRRQAIQRALVGGGLAGAFVLGVRPSRAQGLLVTASGSGVNVKEMPGVDGGEPVPLRESFAFDAHYAQCIIEDNPAAFVMETFAMGSVVIEPHTFFMAMYSNDARVVGIARGPDNQRVARLAGQLGCVTAAATATLTVGSRTTLEPADFEIEAVDAGLAGGRAGDRFAFTVFFNEALAPVNYAIFGPAPTFTGDMVAGEITIAAPIVRPLEG